jgi:hypothetical protein
MSAGAGSAVGRRAGTITVLAAAMLVFAPPAAAIADNNLWQEPFGVLLTDEPVRDSNLSADEQQGEPLTPLGPGYCNTPTRQVEMVATKWYRFVGNGGRISVNTAGSNFDTVLAAYIGSTPRSDDPLPCNDDAGGLRTSALGFDSVANQTYLIQVGGCKGCGGAERGSIVLNVHADPPPPNPPPPPPPPPPAPPPPPPEPKRIAARSILSTAPYFRRVGPSRKPRYLGLKIRSLVVTQVPAGTEVRMRCSRTCTPRSDSETADATQRVVFRDIRKEKLKKGTTIVITATRPGSTGAWIKYRILSNKLKKRQRCLFAGDLKPDKC